MQEFIKGELLYEGKAKKIYAVGGEPQLVWMEFKDSLTAFNAQKKGSFEGKGQLNQQISEFIFSYLKSKSVNTHWVTSVDANNVVVLRLDIIPLEVVIRNRVAGSLAKRFGLEEGQVLPEPLTEFYYKDDELGDPFVSREQIRGLSLVPESIDLDELFKKGLEINTHLKALFDAANIDLVDFKVEFGVDLDGQVVLADEITPDSCRLWDRESGEKLDKDRFRRDLGRVQESYEEVLVRLKSLQEV